MNLKDKELLQVIRGFASLVLLLFTILACDYFLGWNSNSMDTYLRKTSWKSLTVQYCLTESNGIKSVEMWIVSNPNDLLRLKSFFEAKDVKGPITFRLIADTMFRLVLADGQKWEFSYHRNPNHVSIITGRGASYGAALNLQFYAEIHKMLESHLAATKHKLYACELLVCQLSR